MYNEARQHAHSAVTGYAARGGIDGSTRESATSIAADPGLARTVELPCTTVSLTSLSFGIANEYERHGGQPVIADDSNESAPLDLSRRGLVLPSDLGHDGRALAAFVIGAKSIRIRASFAAEVDGHDRRGFVRAFAGGQERVHEFAVTFVDGVADADLPVVGISTAVVGVVEESWSWECRFEGEEFQPIECAYAGATIETFPIRIYLTAARTISRCPRESFYHVACTLPGAKDARHAERDVWRHFTAFRRGKFLANARGERLGFWRDCKPGVGQADFISRNAQDLVTKTDSSCRGWAELFREALAAHGIASTVRAVRPKLSAVHPRLGLPTFLVPDGNGGKAVTRTVGILVKPFKWKPQSELKPTSFTREEAEMNAARFLWRVDNPVDPQAYDWPEVDAIDLMRPGHTSPEEGQCVYGMFGNHAVVVVKHADGGEAWYDPSFGFGPHRSMLDYENDLLGRGEDYPGGLFAIIGWKRELRTNPATGTVEEHNAGLLLGAAPAPPGAVLEAVDPE